jgi:hypothetical protein
MKSGELFYQRNLILENLNLIFNLARVLLLLLLAGWLFNKNNVSSYSSAGNSLVTLLCHLFNSHGLIHHFKLDMVTLHRFLGKSFFLACPYTTTVSTNMS